MLRTSRPALAALALALAGPLHRSDAGEILINPGFETGGLAPWFADSGAPVVTSDEAHTGLFSVAAFGDDSIRQDFAAVATADITAVSFWVKRAGGPFDQYSFYYDDATFENLLVFGSGDDWNFFDVTSELDAGKNLVGFSIFGTSSGPAFLDDFSIRTGGVVPEPSSVILAGVGVLGIALAARRRSDRS